MNINTPYKKVESSGLIYINLDTITCNETIQEIIMFNKNL